MHETTAVENEYIRGVNLGGWLLMERYIIPYQFSITDCHVRGDFCWYPEQASAPATTHPGYKECDLSVCHPVRIENAFGNVDYPVDEKTLAEAFLNEADKSNATSIAQQRHIAEQWFNHHFDNFIRFEDLKKMKDVGVTHVRVPLPHWILGDVEREESWIVGKRWEAFLRLCQWARDLELQVWPDIHTAPGSQNGFDNSGQALPYMTCQVWSYNPTLIQRSLDDLAAIVNTISDEGFQDVVTGFGLLNEPFADCYKPNYLDFLEKGLDIVRDALGRQTAIYVSDMFEDSLWNDGKWWLDEKRHHNTYLDSHYYQCFDESTRSLSPRQHIGFVCQRQHERAVSCCYQDPPHNTKPSKGVSRMVGEWSASFDILPAARINEIMEHIAKTGKAPYMNRIMSDERKDFLSNYVKAQMVSFEDAGYEKHAWFYWSAKMENAAFAEWDFLRGIDEGWFPTPLQAVNTSSASAFGNCYDIMFETSDNYTIVQEYPNPEDAVVSEHETIVDDDIVVSHGESLHDVSLQHHNHQIHEQQLKDQQTQQQHRSHARLELPYAVLFIALVGIIARYARRTWSRRSKYTPIGNGNTGMWHPQQDRQDSQSSDETVASLTV